MFISKTRPTPEQFYVRVSLLLGRFGQRRGFRQPPTSKHAGARDPKPLLLERMAHERLGEPLPGRSESTRGQRRRARQRLCDLTVRTERAHRIHEAEYARGETTRLQSLATFMAKMRITPEWRAASRIAYGGK